MALPFQGKTLTIGVSALGTALLLLLLLAYRRRHPAWRQMRWLRVCARRAALLGGPVASNALYASIAFAQRSLHHLDPLIFVAAQMTLLAPMAGLFLWRAYRSLSPLPSTLIRQGITGGLALGGGFVGVALSLRTIGMIPTASLTALDGILAGLLSWFLLRRRPSRFTCLAAACAGGGAILLWWVTPGAWQTDLIALGSGCFFSLYALCVERSAIARRPTEQVCAFLGGLFLAMAAVTIVLALSFGTWSSLATFSPNDVKTLIFTSLTAVLFPVVISTYLLRVLSAVTLAFCAMLEPLMSIGFASVLGTCSLVWYGWLGLSCLLVSILLQAASTAGIFTHPSSRDGKAAADQTSHHIPLSQSRQENVRPFQAVEFPDVAQKHDHLFPLFRQPFVYTFRVRASRDDEARCSRKRGQENAGKGRKRRMVMVSVANKTEQSRRSDHLRPGPPVPGHTIQYDEDQHAWIIDQMLIRCSASEYLCLKILLEQANRCVPFTLFLHSLQEIASRDAQKPARMRIAHLVSRLRPKIWASGLDIISVMNVGYILLSGPDESLASLSIACPHGGSSPGEAAAIQTSRNGQQA